jgi:hypothetical protein
MTEGAYVGSIDAVRDFRAALHTFLQEVRESMCSYDLEMRRTLEWLLEAQPKRWQQEARRSEDAIVQAKIELERCRSSKLPGGEQPSCSEERKSLERARQRRDYVLEKIEAVRKWGYVVEREAAEYTGRANQLSGVFDSDLPQAIATLDRVLTALESYAALKVESSAPALGSASTPAPDRPPIARPAAEAPPAQDPGVASATDETQEQPDESTGGAGEQPATGDKPRRGSSRA